MEAVARAVADAGRACLACAPTAEGVLTSVGAAYLARVAADRVRLVRTDMAQPCLGEQVVEVPTLDGLALRVHRGHVRALTKGCERLTARGACPSSCRHRCTRVLAYAAASDEPDMPEALHRYLREVFAWGRQARFRNSLPAVARAEELARSMSQECERARQFVRFSRLADGSFFAAYRPSGDVVPLVAGHFKRRMGTERFVLADPCHGRLALHSDGRLTLVALAPEEVERLCGGHRLAADEPYVRALWKRFYDGLELPGRDRSQRGYDLRQQFMPQRLWEGLPELDPRTDTAWSWVPPAYRGTQSALGSPRLDAAPGPRPLA